MKKKVLALVLCAAMASTMAVGCGGSADKKDDKKEDSMVFGSRPDFTSYLQ